MIRNPAISVVMPVYNTEKYVGEAIQSILDQTFVDFEFIIVNDGSTDNSLEVISTFRDKRIRLINCKTNSGNYPARNRGMIESKGKYICVMDSDDFSTMERLEKQYKYMEEAPEVGISGGGFRIYDREEDVFFRETDYENIKVLLLRSFCFYHTALIFRHDLLKKHNLGYNENYLLAADYDLVVRAARHFPITNIPEDIFHYRIHDEQNSWKYRPVQTSALDSIRYEQLKYIGIEPDAKEFELHLNLLNKSPIKYNQSGNIQTWIEKVILTNKKKNYYNHERLVLFFNSLLSEQPFLKKASRKYLDFKSFNKKESKSNLNDISFCLITRIHSYKQIENLNAVIRYITDHFITRIKIIEADFNQKYFPDLNAEGIHYEFIKDDCPVLRKNFLIKNLLHAIDTPFFSLWDKDIIVSVEQVLQSIKQLRSNEVILSLPYDGRIYACDDQISGIFKQTLDINVLQKYSGAFPLYNGWHSCGSVFFANKEMYSKTFCGSENIINQRIADEERIKRMEVLGISFSRVKGQTFHLFHPGLQGNDFNRNTNEINDRKILLKTCSEIQL